MCHSVGGASLRLMSRTGRSIVASRSAEASDVDPCELRKMLAARATAAAPACWLGAVERVELGGALEDHGGGLHSFDWRTTRVWVFATLLSPASARATIAQSLAGASGHPAGGGAEPAADELGVQVVPDDLLGVSLVFAPEQPDLDPSVTQEAMRTVSAACIVHEMVGGALAVGER
jgi:hypothetical protein